MDLRQITYFVALFEEGSVTRAARRVNVVQPALSMQIAKLERELDQRLFERRPKSMEPTAAGRTLHRLVAPIFRDIVNARAHMMRLHTEVSGRVNIGLLSSLTSSVVPSALARFAKAYPDVEVSIADGYSSTFIDWVGAGKLDVAIINKPPHKIGLVAEPMLDEEMVLVAACNTQLPVSAPIAMRDLTRFGLILPSPRHGLRIELDRHLAAEDVTVTPKLELDALPAIAEFITATEWCSVLPSLAVYHGLVRGSLKAHRIVAPRITRQLVAAHNPKHPMSAAAVRLIEVLVEELKTASARLQDLIITGPD
jgi:LysR family nitrogen assimilation transcriptional regulator